MMNVNSSSSLEEQVDGDLNTGSVVSNKAIQDGLVWGESEDKCFLVELEKLSIPPIGADYFDESEEYAGSKSQLEQHYCATENQVTSMEAKENLTNKSLARLSEKPVTVRYPLRKEHSSVNNNNHYYYGDYICMRSATKEGTVGVSVSTTSSQSEAAQHLIVGDFLKNEDSVVSPNTLTACNTTSNDSKLTYTAEELQEAVLKEMPSKSSSLKQHSKSATLFGPRRFIFHDQTFFENTEIEYALSKKETSLKSISLLVVKIHKTIPENKIDLIIQALRLKGAETEKVTVVSDGALQACCFSDINSSAKRLHASIYELLFRTCGFSTAKYQSPKQIRGVSIEKIDERLRELNMQQELHIFNLLVEYLTVKDGPT